MVWIVPVLMWLWWGSDRPAGARWWALGAATLFYVAPMWILAHGPAFDTHERGWTLLASNSFAMAALVFMVGVAMWLWRRRKTS
jgi:hypothetical protein